MSTPHGPHKSNATNSTCSHCGAVAQATKGKKHRNCAGKRNEGETQPRTPRHYSNRLARGDRGVWE